MPKPRSLSERLWEKVDRKGPDECWPWLGSKTTGGYGQLRGGAGDGRIGAHVAAYELTKGPVPEGLEIDHTCHRRDCCNPAHLDATTHAINMKRTKRALRSTCKWGHAIATRASDGRRVCHACLALAVEKHWEPKGGVTAQRAYEKQMRQKRAMRRKVSAPPAVIS